VTKPILRLGREATAGQTLAFLPSLFLLAATPCTLGLSRRQPESRRGNTADVLSAPGGDTAPWQDREGGRGDENDVDYGRGSGFELEHFRHLRRGTVREAGSGATANASGRRANRGCSQHLRDLRPTVQRGSFEQNLPLADLSAEHYRALQMWRLCGTDPAIVHLLPAALSRRAWHSLRPGGLCQKSGLWQLPLIRRTRHSLVASRSLFRVGGRFFVWEYNGAESQAGLKVTVRWVVAMSLLWARRFDCQNGRALADAGEGCGSVRGVRETNCSKPLASCHFGDKSSFP
jgi:hypothetical protein